MEGPEFSSAEETSPILFHFEDTHFNFPHPNLISAWVSQVIQLEACRLHFINFIFCSDPYLHTMNVEYLHHDTLTDVITFPYQDPPIIEGDIFISIDRIQENAKAYSGDFYQELFRVMIHGVLHLCGFTDKTDQDKTLMTKKENRALALLDINQLKA